MLLSLLNLLIRGLLGIMFGWLAAFKVADLSPCSPSVSSSSIFDIFWLLFKSEQVFFIKPDSLLMLGDLEPLLLPALLLLLLVLLPLKLFVEPFSTVKCSSLRLGDLAVHFKYEIFNFYYFICEKAFVIKKKRSYLSLFLRWLCCLMNK